MQIVLHVYLHDATEEHLLPLVNQILHRVNSMATHAEMTAELTAIKDQVVKSRTEVLKKIADLEAAQANAGNTTPEEDAAMAALKQEVQATDDIVPDQPATP